jgi:RHS repeat-associated protein
LDSYSYIPDPLGLRTNIVRNLGLTTNSVSIGIDNIGQLTSWSAKETGGTPRQNEQLGWQYDPGHNVHTRSNGGLTQTFTTDAANQLNTITRAGTYTLAGATPAPATNITVNGIAAQIYSDLTFACTNLALTNGNNTFTITATNVYGVKATNTLAVNFPATVTPKYDQNGNLTNDGLKSFAYDAENQLINLTLAGKFKKDFVYDGLNRLRIKRESTWTGTWSQTNEIHYIWDGNVIVQLRDSNNVPTLTLTRGLDLSGSLQGAGGIGGLLAMTDGGGTNYFCHSDGNGNVTALIDSQETIVARREYDGFGRTVSLSGTKTGINPFWFSSQLHDEDTDIYSFLYRPYSPVLGRFLNNDPIQEDGGHNLYCFVDNNPVNAIDPLGLDAVIDILLPDGRRDFKVIPDTTEQKNAKRNADYIEVGKEFWHNGGQDAAMMAVPGPEEVVIGKTIVKIAKPVVKVCGKAVPKVEKIISKAVDPLRKHHSWPKYLGGAEKQDLVPLPKSLHDAYHSGLDKILPRQKGTEYYESLSGSARDQVLLDLADYTLAFDAKYGTTLYQAMLKEGFPLP